MPRILALTQLLIVGLGAPLLHLLVKIQPSNERPGATESPIQFLAQHVLWLFLVPILYAAVGTALRGKISEKPIRIVGVALCVLLLLLFGIPIALYLR